MGEYLNVGVVVAVETGCQVIEHMEQIRKDLIEETKLPLEDYIIVQDEKGYFNFTLKEEYYGETLVSFMKNQTSIADRMPSDTLNKLANIKSFKDLQNIDRRLLLPFQLLTFNQYQHKIENGTKVITSVKAITYARDGKIVLEGGEWIFEYFEHNIHLQPHPIAKYVKVNIS